LKPDAFVQQAEAPNAVAPTKDNTGQARPESKSNEVAMVSPVQAAAPVQSEQSKADRGLAIYNGKWLGTMTGTCPHLSSMTVSISNGNVTMLGARGSGRVSADGTVVAHLVAVGLIHATVTGKMTSSTSGSGTWNDELGCTGGWTLNR
jgi:hypothetical protein